MIHVITYDLRKPGKDYPTLIHAIKSLGGWWKPLLSTWIVDTPYSPEEIVNILRQHMDATDGLFVARLSGNWWTFGLDTEGIAWMKGRTF